MLADDHDQPLDPPGGTTSRLRWQSAARRFDQLLRPGRMRRVSPRRLALGLLLLGGGIWAGFVAGRTGSRRLAAWVAEQPGYQIRFDAITLVPPPPPFIRRGTEGVLAPVRRDGKYPEVISVLDLDADRLSHALRRSPWIERVNRVRRSYHRLTVEVVYRQPTALMVWPSGELNRDDCVLVDRCGVEMPYDKGPFDWQEDEPRTPRYVPRGGHPLVQIRGFGRRGSSRTGQPFEPIARQWGGPLVAQAVDLAEFLAQRHLTESTPGSGLDFPRIRLDEHTHGFWLIDGAGAEVYWGTGPGAEGLDEPRAIEKWTMLRRFVGDRGGSIRLKPDEYLVLGHSGVTVQRFAHRSRSGPASERTLR